MHTFNNASPYDKPSCADVWRRELAAGVCYAGIHDLAAMLAEISAGGGAGHIPTTQARRLHTRLRQLAAILRVNPREETDCFYWLDCIRSALDLWECSRGTSVMTIRWECRQEPWLLVHGQPDLWLQAVMSWLWDLRFAGISSLWLHTHRTDGNRMARCELQPLGSETSAILASWSAETMRISQQSCWQISELPGTGGEIRFPIERAMRPAPAQLPFCGLKPGRLGVVRILAITRDHFWREWLKKWVAPATLCCQWIPDMERARLCLRSRQYQAVVLEWEHLGAHPEAIFYSLQRANPGLAGHWLTITSDAGNSQFQAAMRKTFSRWLQIPFEPETGRDQLQKILAEQENITARVA